MPDIWLEMQNHSGRQIGGIVNRDRNPEFPGGGDYFHAAKGRRDESVKGFCRWCFRESRAYRCNAHNLQKRDIFVPAPCLIWLSLRSERWIYVVVEELIPKCPRGNIPTLERFFLQWIYGDDVAGCCLG